MTNTCFERFADIEGASLRAAELAAQALARAVTARGRASLALSGGTTPGRFFELLAGQKLPWNAVHIFWADERLVSRDSPRSNYRPAKEKLLSRIAIPEANVHPMWGGPSSPDEAVRPAGDSHASPGQAATAYEEMLRRFFENGPPAFDVVHLGLGGDGHTASLFPGQPALSEEKHWVLPVEYAKASPPVPRLTLTLPALNAADLVFFLISGVDKVKLAQKILAGEGEEYPAARVRPERPPVWLMALF